MFTLNLVTRSRRVMSRDVGLELAQSEHDIHTAAAGLLAAAVSGHSDIVDANVCWDDPRSDTNYRVLAHWAAGAVRAGEYS